MSFLGVEREEERAQEGVEHGERGIDKNYYFTSLMDFFKNTPNKCG